MLIESISLLLQTEVPVFAGFRAGPFGVPGACLQVPATWPLQVVHSTVVVPFKPSELISDFSDSYDLEKIAFEELAVVLALVLQWLRLYASNKGWGGFNAGSGTKILSMPHGQKKKKKRKKRTCLIRQSHLDNLPFTILGDITPE